MPYPVPTPVFKYLATSTGGIEAVGAYSGGSPGVFALQPSTGEVIRLERMMIHLRDTGALDAEGYGNGTALSNGVQVRVQTDTGTIIDLLDGQTITTNSQWARQCYDVRVDTYGTGDESLSGRWTFSKAGYPLRLDGDLTERLEVRLIDSTTHLVEHTFMVQGYYEDEAYEHGFNR